MTMKCEDRVVSALILRDRGRRYIQHGRASPICMLLCVENLAGHEYILKGSSDAHFTQVDMIL